MIAEGGFGGGRRLAAGVTALTPAEGLRRSGAVQNLPMPIAVLARHLLGDTVALYRHDAASGRVGLSLVPLAAEAAAVAGRADCRTDPAIRGIWHLWQPGADRIDPLVHVHVVGRAQGGGFPAGRTLRNSASTEALKLVAQRVEVLPDGGTCVVTRLADGAGLEAEHRLSWSPGDGAVNVATAVINTSAAPLALDLVTSASLDGITPFATDDAPGRLRVHRWRAAWSNEAMLTSQGVEELGLERSWIGHSVQVERFGQAGTMPVNGWHPCVVVEDTVAGVCWGLQLRWGASWQLELYRRDDHLAVSGGLADRELGHWRKTLAPGERFDAPPAWLACAAGDLETCCERLTRMQRPAAAAAPAVERDLPIVFNEWCTSWGDPSHERMLALADRLAGTPVRYLVIDAGWYKGEGTNWGDVFGDWQASTRLFPQGIAATAAAIRARGLIPGLWFEMETVGIGSRAIREHAADLLQRDGALLQTGSRAFWDLRREGAHAYLAERVAGLLRDAGFGYLKVDYNESTGPIVDGDESPGEGLRRHQLGIVRWWRRLRELLPELVIETCASGGHRVEPSMLALAAQASSSDAHETLEIPLIAADLQHLMLPRQNQVWAVLHESDDDRRLVWSLAATFLGRMCLSGPVERLSPAQWALACRAMQLYRRSVLAIDLGSSRLLGTRGGSRRHPTGWQGVLRTADDGRHALAVVHALPGSGGSAVTLPLSGGPWVIAGTLSADGPEPVLTGEGLRLHLAADWTAQVVLLERTQPA
jgi:alpha-galactosidase